MDTTDKYIKMCEQAREIQANWNISVGDCYLKRRDCTSPDDMASGYYIEETLTIIGSDDDQSIVYLKRDKDDRDVYLPRQDQLQEMIDKAFGLFRTDGNKHRGTYGCNAWKNEETLFSGYCDTAEQALLRIVMEQKYGKVWNGEEWVKEG